MSKNIDVAITWKNGKALRTRTMCTDGENIYSYRLLIGITKNEEKIAYDYTSTGKFVSVTTSKHSNLVKNQADKIENKL